MWRLLVGLCATLAILSAQPAEKTMRDYVDAAGGREAFDRVQSRYAEAAMEIMGQGIQLDLKIWSVKPNKMSVEATADVIGKIVRTTDGKRGWVVSTTGPQVLAGDELQSFIEEATMDRLVYWKDSFQSCELAGKGEVAGSACTKVKLTSASGNPMIVCFDDSNKLPSLIETVAKTAGGSIPVSAVMKHYRSVDGVMMPHEVETRIASQTRVTRLESVKHNLEIPPGLFEPSAEIKELMSK